MAKASSACAIDSALGIDLTKSIAPCPSIASHSYAANIRHKFIHTATYGASRCTSTSTENGTETAQIRASQRRYPVRSDDDERVGGTDLVQFRDGRRADDARLLEFGEVVSQRATEHQTCAYEHSNYDADRAMCICL
jgi:hypothetical protein